MTQSAYKVGDVVRLNSGGPFFTVVAIAGGKLEILGFSSDGNSIVVRDLPPKCVTKTSMGRARC